MTGDPYGWLEEVDGARALDWVRARNAETSTRPTASPFRSREIRAVLDADARIP